MAGKYCSVKIIQRDTPSEFNYSEHINEIMKLFEEMESDKEILISEQSKKDQEISDVLHILETLHFNAAEGYNLAKKLQKLRIERRNIKNKLQQNQCLDKIINTYKQAGVQTLLLSTYNKLNNMERKQENAKYHIRQLSELETFNKISRQQKLDKGVLAR